MMRKILGGEWWEKMESSAWMLAFALVFLTIATPGTWVPCEEIDDYQDVLLVRCRAPVVTAQVFHRL